MYSDFAVTEIAEGEDYFSNCYQMPEQVAKHIHQRTIVGEGYGARLESLIKRVKSSYQVLTT